MTFLDGDNSGINGSAKKLSEAKSDERTIEIRYGKPDKTDRERFKKHKQKAEPPGSGDRSSDSVNDTKATTYYDALTFDDVK